MRLRATLLCAVLAALACASGGDRRTLAELHQVDPDLREVAVEDGLDRAMHAYREFLDETPESALTPEAMRRLADLKLEKEFGILGDAGPVELPAPRAGDREGDAENASASERSKPASIADLAEPESDFERRASARVELEPSRVSDAELPGAAGDASRGPLEAIALYDEILETYPDYPNNDQVLYQKARALDELGRNDEAIPVIERLVARYPHSRYVDEVQFRRAEYFFTRRQYLDAEESYLAVTRMGPGTQYYELALYKLGWTYYKQYLHEEALDQYVALLDYKVDTGYDFEQAADEDQERRIADTFRVISLSFSSLGGPDSVRDYFALQGHRRYEDKIYSHLGEFYLEKLRYQDAADAYQTFVGLYPFHKVSPHFDMRVVEIYEAGSFPKLVLDSKKRFASSYGLDSEYWRHFEAASMPEVLAYLKQNLEDLASHYHALYQEPEQPEDKPAHFAEALRWYRSYLASFPEESETPGIHYKLADLLLEDGDFGTAAREYEQIAYGYPAHEQASAAGYAAIYAHREHEKQAEGVEKSDVTRSAVESTLRFVEAFPDHEHAAVVLGAAVDDLYDMGEPESALVQGRRLLESYPEADAPVRRSAWAAVAHASMDTGRYPEAEEAYGRVLEMTAADHEERQGLVDHLAASIYKQGEQADEAGDFRLAADHFLRIREVAPGSEIRAAAEYDAGAALMRLEDWTAAVQVLDAFREAHPDHELNREATKQIATIHREQGELAEAAAEYERVAGEAEQPELRSEALLLAGELYEDSARPERALAVYQRYVEAFPEPLELAVETRFKIATLQRESGDLDAYHAELRNIVASDREAGPARTARVRFLAAKSALVLSEEHYERFAAVKLVQPFERNLKEKQRRMQKALDAFGALVDYEVAEVTAAATWYMAEVYYDFSQALLASERPDDLSPSELADYELVLEEEAFPFEERAIAVHEKNLELMRAGVYDEWIEKSLARLAVLMPGRYAKFELSPGWLGSVEVYAYSAPTPTPAPAAPTSEPAVQPAEAPVQPSEPAVQPAEVPAPPDEELATGPEEEDEAPPAAPDPQAGDDPQAGADVQAGG